VTRAAAHRRSCARSSGILSSRCGETTVRSEEDLKLILSPDAGQLPLTGG
jgi:hypothetical protein